MSLQNDIWYVLDEDNNPVRVPLEEHATWLILNDDRRQVKFDQLKDVVVSTVFLCLDASLGMGLKPLLFETMVFGLAHELRFRYQTYSDALKGHQDTVRKLQMNKLAYLVSDGVVIQ